MNEITFSVEGAPEGGYIARALGYSLFTEADDLKSLYENLKDALHCHFEDENKPKIIRLHFAKEEIVAA